MIFTILRVDFFRLVLAFAAVLVLIDDLMVGWFKSFLTPLIVMVVIPFSFIGVRPHTEFCTPFLPPLP
jgi:multidrug efflux pump subunit AcrB